jgi:4-aminobutyrate--pyruvate transaminase
VGAYLVRRAQAHGLILRVLGGDVVAFSPPLVITEAEIDELLAKTALALDDTLAWVRGGF